VKDANQCRTHSLVESEKVLSLAPNHGVRLPNGSSSNPVYGISPGILIHAMRINHDMCVFAHIHSLGSAHLRTPAARRPNPPRAAGSTLRSVFDSRNNRKPSQPLNERFRPPRAPTSARGRRRSVRPPTRGGSPADDSLSP